MQPDYDTHGSTLDRRSSHELKSDYDTRSRSGSPTARPARRLDNLFAGLWMPKGRIMNATEGTKSDFAAVDNNGAYIHL